MGGFALIYPSGLPEGEFHSNHFASLPMPAKPDPKPDDRPPAGASAWKSVRRSKVARARKLVADPDYPPKKVMQAVADLLARKLGAAKVKRETRSAATGRLRDDAGAGE